MRHKCVIDTSGYKLVFYLQSLDHNKECVAILVEFILNPCYRNFLIRSEATTTYITQLQNLAAYLKNHIANLKNNPNSQSHAFITYDTSFWIQASQGEIRSENEGEFTIHCMINIGKGEGDFSTYLGGEAVISIQNAKDFISSLNTALMEFTKTS